MIEVHDLYKKYGKCVVLDRLSFSLKKGEVFGFVGPNGVGKTTTMRIMSGLLKADSGKVYIENLDVEKDSSELKSKIGYMPDFFGVYDNLKVIEYMEFYASIYGIVGKDAHKLCMELLDRINLTEKADSYVDELSRGMKQKLCLARCMVHNPDILILDEPFSELDPGARHEMRKFINMIREMNKTIIISSHILSELSEMCTTIGIINNGKMIVKGTEDEIMMHFNAANPMKMRILGGKEEAISILKKDDRVNSISIEDEYIIIGFTGGVEDEADLLKKLIDKGVIISSFVREKGSLEQLFLKVTGRQEVLKG